MKRRQLVLVLGLAAAMVAPVQAQQFFRIGTGGTAGTYYPVGGMIANAVSQPGKIVATAQATNGSVANVNGVAGGAKALAPHDSSVCEYEDSGRAFWWRVRSCGVGQGGAPLQVFFEMRAKGWRLDLGPRRVKLTLTAIFG